MENTVKGFRLLPAERGTRRSPEPRAHGAACRPPPALQRLPRLPCREASAKRSGAWGARPRPGDSGHVAIEALEMQNKDTTSLNPSFLKRVWRQNPLYRKGL